MTDRERLMELIRKAREQNHLEVLLGDADRLIDMPRGCEYLADYLIANGVIVPPCKMDELLYCTFSHQSLGKEYTNIEARRINEIMFFGDGRFVFGAREINGPYSNNVVLGKNAFKTFEEAEQVLKRGDTYV